MRNLTWGFILIIIGVLVLLDNLGVADIGDMIHDFWPVILILWGVSVLLKKRKANSPPPAASSPRPAAPPPPPDPGHSEPTGGSETVAGEGYAGAESSSAGSGGHSQSGSWTAPGSGASYQASGGPYQYESELLHQ